MAAFMRGDKISAQKVRIQIYVNCEKEYISALKKAATPRGILKN